jgi:hypothetical protein
MLLTFARDGGGLLAVHAHDVLRVERREVPDSREGAPRDAKTSRVFLKLASEPAEYRLAHDVSAEEVVERVNAALKAEAR